MNTTLNAFADAIIARPELITGGGLPSKPDDDCCCSSPRKGNNGIGQEKRGIDDGTPPGLQKNGKSEFNDGAASSGFDPHGVGLFPNRP